MTRENRQILKQASILIVDDNAQLRSELKDLLTFYMFEIYEASDGLEAFKIFQDKKPTIIFSDIKMPNENGIELVKKIRKESQTTPIVLISAHSEKKLLFEAVKLNLVDYLIKPVLLAELKVLLSQIAESIDKKGLLKVKLSKQLYFDTKEKVLYDNHTALSLTTNEQRLLALFIEREEEILSETYIIEYIWKHEIKTISALRNLISRLRSKIGESFIESIYGQGYRFKR